MTEEERRKKFERERRRQRNRKVEILQDVDDEIRGHLEEARDRINGRLGAGGSDFENFVLPSLKREIDQLLEETGEKMAASAAGAADRAFEAGADLIDKPIAAGGIEIAAVLPKLNRGQVMAIRSFLTGRMKDVTVQARRRINAEIGQVIIGTQTAHQATERVAKHLTKGGISRAQGIVRTEVGRAYSTATQQRMDQAVQKLPGLQKIWRRSGKINSRVAHDLADGQTRPVDKPFDVGGEQLMYPRDPKGSAKNTIRCGCDNLPHMAHWEMKHPKDQPFTDRERALSPLKHRIDAVRLQGYDTWSRNVIAGRVPAAGNFETVANLGEPERAFLIARGIEPATMEIAISDRRIRHMARDAKRGRGNAVPPGVIRRLPDRLLEPKAILWQKTAKTPTLIYVFEVKGEKRLAAVPVKIRRRDRTEKVHNHNWIASGGMIDPSNLKDGNRYAPITGEI